MHPWLKSYPKDVKSEISLAPDLHIAKALEDAAKKYSDRISFSFFIQGFMHADITYTQSEQHASNLASYMQNTLGIKQGDRIGIMMPNIINYPICFFAAQKIGAITVNTNPLYTPREMKHQFNDAQIDTIFIVDIFLDKLEKIIEDTKIKNIIVVRVSDYMSFVKGAIINTRMKLKKVIPQHNLKNVVPFKTALKKGAAGKRYSPPNIKLEDVAVLQYTGGTTGVAKGAMLNHKNLLSNVFQVKEYTKEYLFEGTETFLTALPLYHIFALTANFLFSNILGSRNVLIPNPRETLKMVESFKRYKPTVFTGVNTLYNSLNHNSAFKELAPKSLSLALAGGMALQTSVAQEFKDITGCTVRQAYGLTECSPAATMAPLDKTPRIGSIGLPLPGTVVKIIDEDCKDLPAGEVGEMVIKGDQVMKGYWRREEATEECIVEGFLHTGDIAKMDEDGYFFIVDRKKDMILVSGFNVYPNEVEDVIASHPKVLETAVIGISDKNSGELVKAFIVAKDESLTESEIKEFCRENLTGYKRPRLIEFRKDLPKTNVGKILRRALKEEESAARGNPS